MLKSTRRKLFYALVAVFLVLGAGVVLYAEGWRIDFAKWRPVRSGGIFVRAYPEEAAITLSGKPVESQLGLISRGTLINGLLPGTYTLTLNLPGYQTWHETAPVAPALVAEFKYAVLAPERPAATTVGALADFGLTSDGPVAETYAGITAGGKNLGSGKLVGADPLSPAVLLERPSGNYALYDLAAAGSSVNLSNLFAANGISLANTAAPLANPYNNPTQLVVANNSRIWILDTNTQGLVDTERASSGMMFAPPIAFSPSWAAWSIFAPAQNVSRLAFYDINADVSARSSSTIPGKTVQLAWLSGSNFATLQSNGELYRYDLGARTFTKVADAVTGIAVSTKENMLAALERRSVEVFALASNDPASSYWRFRLPNPDQIRKLIWYRDGRHLFVIYPDRVSFLDLTDTTLMNFATVAQGTNPAYDPNTNEFYLLDPQRRLERFDFPK